MYITGTRADYGLMRSVLRSIQATRSLDLSIIATGMHLSHEFGSTIHEIEDDGFRIAARIHSLGRGDTGAGMLRSFSRFTSRLADTLETLRPSILLLLGDRWEMLAGAMAGSYMNIPVVHMAGGDVSGSVDEPNRHAVTRFAHVHLVATREHARVLTKMGEQESRIHIVGAPGLDDIVSHNYTPPEVVFGKYGIEPSGPHALLVQHPVVSECDSAGAHMGETLDAILRLRLRTTAIFPNADAGGRQIIRVMRQFAKGYPLIRLYKSIPRDDYLGIMAISNVIVGNSSSGIVEAPLFRLPCVNIGTRQLGRIQAANVVNVGYDAEEIGRAIRKALSERFRRELRGLKNPYGDGHTGPRVARILAKLQPTAGLLQKRLGYRKSLAS